MRPISNNNFLHTQQVQPTTIQFGRKPNEAERHIIYAGLQEIGIFPAEVYDEQMSIIHPELNWQGKEKKHNSQKDIRQTNRKQERHMTKNLLLDNYGKYYVIFTPAPPIKNRTVLEAGIAEMQQEEFYQSYQHQPLSDELTLYTFSRITEAGEFHLRRVLPNNASFIPPGTNLENISRDPYS